MIVGRHVWLSRLFVPMMFHLAGCARCNPEAEASAVFSDPDVVKLVVAVERDDVDTVKTLLKAGVDPNARGCENMTPLYRALIAKRKKVYSFLLKNSADPNIIRNDGLSVVRAAAAEDDVFWLSEALSHKANPNLLNTGNRFFPEETVIFSAINEKRTENVKLLIGAGANVDHQSQSKTFPLVEAARKRAFDIVLLLLEAGADFRQKDRHGQDLAYWASGRLIDENEPQKVWYDKTRAFLAAKGVILDK